MPPQRSREQSEFLLEFMMKHPDFANDCFKGSKAEENKLWDELVLNLNACGPPIRDVSSWKKWWSDWRRNAKTRVSQSSYDTDNTDIRYLSPIEWQSAEIDDIVAEECYRRASTSLSSVAEPFLKPSRPASVTRSRSISPIPDLIVKRKRRSVEENQKEESSTVKSEETNASLKDNNKQVISIHSHPSSSSKMSSLSAACKVSSEAETKHSESKEAHHIEQVEEDPNNIKCVAKKIKEINVTLENHSKQLNNINKTLEDMCSLQKQQFEETKRHHVALEKTAMEKIKLKLEVIELRSQLRSSRSENTP